jgi:tetratricopeptide (TPR) repeat protein
MADPSVRPDGAGGAQDPVITSAIRRYEERLAKDPTSLAFAPLAEAYRKAGRTKEAIQLCEEGLRRYPDYGMARVILAKAYLAEGNDEGARAELTTVVARVPGDVQSHRLLAELAVKRGALTEAVTHLERAAELDPGDRDSRAILELLRGENVPGEGSALRRLLEDDTFVTTTFGTLCLRQGLVDEAALIFLRVLKRDPANRGARERLEQALRAKRDRRKG